MRKHKILIENHHGLGDVVHMIPMISNLRQAYPDSDISVIVASEAHADLLRSTKLVDRFYYFSTSKMTTKKIFKFINDIRREKFDMGFLAVGTNKPLGLLLLFLLNCKTKIIEYDKKLIYRYNILQTKEERDLHRVLRNLNLLKPLNIEINDAKPFVVIDNVINSQIQEKVKELDNDKFIGLCVGTNPSIRKVGYKKEYIDAKQWGMEKFVDLAEKLMKNNFNVVLLGGKKEESDINPYIGRIKDNPKLINCINQATIMESAGFTHRCEVVVGCDTGIMHISDAVGVKTLTLFGPTNPKLYGPYNKKAEYLTLNLKCQYCHGTDKLFECKDRKCLNNIAVDQVYNKVLEMINK